jgi:trigger factor
MIEGFEEGIKGAKAGDEMTLNLKFPEDYHYKDVAGKNVDFAVTVSAVKEASLPELSDEFFTKFGVTEGGNEAFRAEVKKNMQLELDKAIDAKLKNQVMDTILEINDVTAPKALVEEEAKNMAEQMQSQYQMQTQGDTQLQTSLFEDQAKRRVTLGMILAELVKVNEITATPELVKEKINEMAATYENPQEVMDYYMSHKEKLAEIESFVLEEKIVDWACEQATIAEKEFSFTEFMNSKKDEEA